jgi:Domain of unknown function (DUF5911)
LNEPIESYGFIGNLISGVLVGQGGSIDWRCLPRFASDAGFAALLGAPDHGSWLIAPHGETKRTRRRYRPRSRNRLRGRGRRGHAHRLHAANRRRECLDLVRLAHGVKGLNRAPLLQPGAVC